jgi:hypothetical protein
MLISTSQAKQLWLSLVEARFVCLAVGVVAVALSK